MGFNSLISRTDAAALVPEEASREIIKGAVGSNPLLQLARKLPDMSRKQRRMPVASAMASAYFLSGETGLKQTTDLAWVDKYIEAEEVAAIVPIPESVLDDADYDIWGEIQPAMVEAFNIAITQAVLYGTNIPASWTANMGAHAGVVAHATAHSKVASIATFTDLYEAIMGESADGQADGLLMLLEAQGYSATGFLAAMAMKGRLRNTRSVDGIPIFTPATGEVPAALDGSPLYFPDDGSFVPASGLLIGGDWRQLVYAMRQDMTYKILTEGVIQDSAGNIVYNLAQQDMIALRAVMRLGFALPNPISRMAQTEASRSPFAVLTA